jgi:hypothetical protein
MDRTAPTWSTPRELVQVLLAPYHLKRTISVALIVGLGAILDGRATVVVWIEAALTYLTPLLVSNFGPLSPRGGLLSSPPHHRCGEGKPRSPPTQQVLATVKGIWQWMKRS